LPKWADVVGYEEKSPAVIARLRCGYPRFFIHPEVAALAREIAGNRPALPFPSVAVARRAAEFVRHQSALAAEVLADGPLPAVVTSGPGLDVLRSFWQHSGLVVSSRRAVAIREQRPAPDHAEAVFARLRQTLADLYDCAPGDVFLAPSGMAAQLAALDAVRARSPGLPTAQLGFPYVDTLKLQQKFGRGTTLLHDLEKIPDDLSALVAAHPLAACFAEIPGNPLLGSPDLARLSPLLRQHRLPLVADDVVATPHNVDLSPYADLIATSLTKFLSGSGDVLGGALICNPRSPLHAELLPIIAAQHAELLWWEDAGRVLERIADFPGRMARHNRNGLLIAERLRSHPSVERLWYPKWESGQTYETVRRPGGGWGALVTFLPAAAEKRSPEIYDRFNLSKGPSLGTDFTLACPFTLLAHYTELDWAEACGVSRYLIRLSVGLEDPEDLWAEIDRALVP
jgi:cystathionine gamma-synthase